MSLKKAIYTYLTAQAGVSSLISTRLYPSIAPESATKPYVVYSVVTSDHKHNLLAAEGIVTKRVQFDVYGSTALSVDNVAEAIRAELDGFRGLMGTDSLNVRHVMLSNEVDEFNNPIDGDQNGSHKMIIDYFVTHTESIPTF